MSQSKYRVLLNAEPFGFGPSAAIASIVSLLRTRGLQLSYIGEKHTLDLQKSLAYEFIYDTTDMSQAERLKLVQELASEYDLFFTAMDFAMAEIAEEAGLKTAIYDALTWYWPSIIPAITNADLYIAQNFFGVEQRLQAEAQAFPDYQVVGPLITPTIPAARKDIVLLNMGGLQNPYWSLDDTLTYARTILKAVRATVPTSEELVITTSSSVAQGLHDPAVMTLGREEMITTLAKTKLAIMTPGLGNIYDSAAFNIPTLWLPPANDSQGQQVQLLTKNGCADASIDWDDLGTTVGYTADQKTVLQNITDALTAVSTNTSLQEKLSGNMARELSKLDAAQDSKTTELLERFGTTGVTDICSAIVDYLESRIYADSK